MRTEIEVEIPPVAVNQTFGDLEVVALARTAAVDTITVRYWIVRCKALITPLRGAHARPCGRQEVVRTSRLLFDGWKCCSKCRHSARARERRGAA